jgi:hypothetical protein
MLLTYPKSINSFFFFVFLKKKKKNKKDLRPICGSLQIQGVPWGRLGHTQTLSWSGLTTTHNLFIHLKKKVFFFSFLFFI